LTTGFAGEIYAVNPNESIGSGCSFTFSSVDELPSVDLAVLAIAAQHCLPVVKTLTEENDTKAFIIISAGFGETNEAGKQLEKEIVEVVNQS
jgi:acetate---CoA ligase (ADP-forming)